MPSAAVQKATALAESKDTSKPKLGLVYEGKILEQGQYIPRAAAASAPQLTLPTAGTGTYLAICIDLDPPFSSFPFLGPILHWVQPGLTSDGKALNAGSTPAVADWAPPAPPPAAGPHRYVFLLYEQPAGFDAKKFGPADGKPLPLTARIRWDLEKFQKEAGLGEIVAANFFNSN